MFHVVTTNERFRRLPTLFQALRLSGEDAKVKGMRKVGSYLPFFHVRSFLIPSELPRSMEQTRDCQNIVTVVQPSCQYDVRRLASVTFQNGGQIKVVFEEEQEAI